MSEFSKHSHEFDGGDSLSPPPSNNSGMTVLFYALSGATEAGVALVIWREKHDFQ